MGAFQLPDSVYGAAIGCLSYSGLCLLANVILVWLIWVHRERTSYVAFIAYFTLLATITSLVQQLYDYILWEDIRTWQVWYERANSHDAAVQYLNGVFGLRLALTYVRIFCFMIESSLVFFFSLALAATVYGWWARSVTALRKLSFIGRVLPITLAMITAILLQFEFAHNSFIVYMIIANAQFVLSLVGASIFLAMIIYKYLQTRMRLNTWLTLDYGNNGNPDTVTMASSAKRGLMRSRRSRAYSGSQPSATFDNWLVIRLFIAFAMLCVFEWTNIAPRFENRERILSSTSDIGLDLSPKRAMSTATGYLSGVSPSLLAFLVFGTTKAFQRKMARTFLPACLRGGGGDDDDNLTSVYHLPMSSTTGNSSYARASTALFPNNQTSTNTTAQNGVVVAGHPYRASSGGVRMPDAVVFAPTGRDPDTRSRASLVHYQSASSLSSSKHEISTTTTTTNTTTVSLAEQTSVALPLPTATPGTTSNNTNKFLLSPIREPQWEDWFDDDDQGGALRHSQIGLALSEPPSPAEPPNPRHVVAPWAEPPQPPPPQQQRVFSASPTAAAARGHRQQRPSTSTTTVPPPRRGLTLFRDFSDISSSDETSRPGSKDRAQQPSSSSSSSSKPPLSGSLPVSRFNYVKPTTTNTTAADSNSSRGVVMGSSGGHHRRTSSNTGSITRIWSDGPVEPPAVMGTVSAPRRSTSRLRSRDRSQSGAASSRPPVALRSLWDNVAPVTAGGRRRSDA